MSYVVTNGKKFEEFDSIEEARNYFEKNDSFGMEIKEKDAFGNLKKAEEKAPGTIEEKKEMPEIKEEKITTEEKPKSQAIKYIIIAAMILILTWVFMIIVMPMIKDLGKI
jgi:hypothetical protein